MLPTHTPDANRPPNAHYAHGVEVTAGARLLVSSGQLGLDPDDALPEGAEAQAARCFANLDAILAEAALSFLGLGPQAATSRGALLAQGASYFLLTPHLAIAPGVAINSA